MTAEQSKELLLSVQGLKKNFGEREILKGIDFDVHKGDVVCVIGPSGSGKSTLTVASIIWNNQLTELSATAVKMFWNVLRIFPYTVLK